MTFVVLPPDGPVPARPPADLRPRVLAAAREAAREAAIRPAPSLLFLLLGDQLLCGCAALAVVLALACAMVGKGSAGAVASSKNASFYSLALKSVVRGDDLPMQGGTNLTLAEQWIALAPQLDLPPLLPATGLGAHR